jgi:micrococcal nuclease
MSPRRIALLLTVVTAFVAVNASALPPEAAPTITATVLSVTDGDTIRVRIQSAGTSSLVAGTEWAVRYIGIDTPETVHPTQPVEEMGAEASACNASLVSGRTVYLELDVGRTDLYGRLLAYVYLDAQGYAMVNAILVAMGFANASPYAPNYRYEDVFRVLEAAAREAELGLWATQVPLPPTPPDDTPGPCPCNCTGPDLNCGAFATQAEAQACYDCCKNAGYGDVFGLDGDDDWEACESLP